MPTSSTRLWHPFAAMGKVDGHEFVLTRGEGSRVWDADGHEYVDGTAGLWFCNVGHGREEIADAVARSSALLAAHHVFGDHANEPALELADRLADLAPVETPQCSSAPAAARRWTPPRRSSGATGRSRGSRSERSSSRAVSRTTARTRTGRRSPGSLRCGTDTGRLSRRGGGRHDDPADLERALDELGAAPPPSSASR